MKNVLSFLKGKKTYFVAVAGAIYGALIATGQVENEAWVWGVLGAGGLASLRKGIGEKSGTPGTRPSDVLRMLLCAAVLVLGGGCATFTTDQKDISYEAITNGTRIASVPLREIRTKVKARTFWDAKSALANFKASQTDKTQGANVGGLGQESSGTNAVAILEKIEAIVKALPK